MRNIYFNASSNRSCVRQCRLYSFTISIFNYLFFSLQDPEFGKWQLYVTCETAYSIRVVGVSTNNFDIGFATVKQKNMTQTSHRPLKGT